MRARASAPERESVLGAERAGTVAAALGGGVATDADPPANADEVGGTFCTLGVAAGAFCAAEAESNVGRADGA